MNAKETINRFMVEIFNNILSQEQNALIKGKDINLSMSEIHVLEAVSLTQRKSINNMTNIANSLNITQGSLTVSLNILVKKKYVYKEKSKEDKRVTLVYLTKKGEEINSKHNQFHKNMIDSMIKNINDSELQTFVIAIDTVAKYFEKCVYNDIN